MRGVLFNYCNGFKLGFLFLCMITSLSAAAANINVTFQVDMSRELGVSSVSVAGDFQGWNTSANPMIDAGGGFYKVTIPITAGVNISYRFVKNGYMWEAPMGACANGINRSTTLSSSDVVLPVECFNHCGTCPTTPARKVTFQVDMSNQIVASSGVHVTGNFQGWDPAATPLTNAGGGIYSVTLPFYSGSLPVEYKFLNGDAWGTDEIIQGNCQAGSNRYFTPPAADSILGLTCYAGCGSCGPTVKVKFQVDMSHVNVSPNGVHLTGNFQGWSPAITSLATSGNGIYSVTIPMTPGTSIQYRFINGNSSESAEYVFGPCAYETKREFTIPSKDTTLSTVCYGYCDAACTPEAGIKVACIGNSITAGSGVDNPRVQSYPARLKVLLGNTFSVENFGHSGATLLKKGDLPYWDQSEFSGSKIYNPDVVVIKLGTNDSKSWNWGPYGGEYVKDYDTLIDVFRSLPSKPKIFICLPSKAFSTAFGIDETVLSAKIRPDVKQAAKDKGVAIIDLYDATQSSPSLFPDGIHPNVAGANKIAARVKQMLTYTLGEITRTGDSLTAPLGDAYQWYFNGDTIAASAFGTSRKLKALQVGEYMVGVKLLPSNEDRAISNVLKIGSLTEDVLSSNIISSSIDIYPNPTHESAVMTISNGLTGLIEVRIIDVMGKVLKSFSIQKREGYSEQELNLTAMPKGIYVIEVAQGKNKGFKRIVKQ